jgi:osmoprotectant transport system ATP-binding protein
MIRFEEVQKSYQGKPAVRGLDLQIPEGKISVIIGPSGCGKSTTLKLINRMIDPDGGRISINGRPVTDRPSHSLRLEIGYVIQEVGLFPHFTVRENILIVPRLLKWDRERKELRLAVLMRLIGLPETYLDKYPHELSGGEAQRVGVARALAADPDILLMDEPFGAVDPLNRTVLQDEFAAIQSAVKKTVVFVTHDIDEAVRLADHLIIMKEGKVVQAASPEEILQSPANRFVRDFIGADRAIKRLSLFSLSEIMQPVFPAKVGEPLPPETAGKSYVWTVSSEGYLTGWADIDGRDPSKPLNADEVSRVVSAELAVFETSSLKTALSRMMGQGVRNLPVLDHSWRLVGQVNFKDIESHAGAEGDLPRTRAGEPA